VLEPEHRSLLLDNLRPPAGYQLDRAVAATFSLDLHALLTAPLAFAMFDAEINGNGSPDIIALLEATRRHSKHISIFCQAGRISVPNAYQPILANIEGSIHEVTAPKEGGIFHPKVWAMRFTSDDAPASYRLLVLSRNLTFDRSWDIVVRLDGQRAPRGERSTASAVTKPLVEFLQRLPTLAARQLPLDERAAIEDLARDLRQVQFELPDGFFDVSFWVSGLAGAARSPFDAKHSRTLIVSPFLTAGLLRKATSSGSRHVLVSRREALDALPSEALDPFEEAFVLDTAVEQAEDGNDLELTGLHAKVFIVEHGGKVSVYAGSANATDAGFGRNVEFLTLFHGYRHRVGIETVLRGGDMGGVGLTDLLTPYVHPDEGPTPETPTEALERQIEELRHRIAALPITVRVEQRPDKDFDLHVTSDSPLPADDDATLTCRPLTLGSAYAYEVAQAECLDIRFDRVSFAALTSFIVFDLMLRRDGAAVSVRFVVNTTLEGAPADRQQRILSSLLDDRSKVLRYLLFLLADPDSVDAATLSLIRNTGQRSDAGTQHGASLPLLEVMLRSLAHGPSRLDPVARLVDDLLNTDQGRRLLPEGIEEVWPQIWQARQGLTP